MTATRPQEDAASLWLDKYHYWIRTVEQNRGPTAVLFRSHSIRLHYSFLVPCKGQKESPPFRLFSLFHANPHFHGPYIEVSVMDSEFQASQWAPFECCIPGLKAKINQ